MARILVVDGDSDSRELLLLAFGKAGHSVTGAGDGRDALVAIGQDGFELVVVDVNIPDMTGFQLVTGLREADRAEPPLVVLMVSTSTTAADVVAGVAAGADEFMTKPFHVADLNTHVDHLLQRRLSA